MISRRSFLTALASLPLIGRFFNADNAALAAVDEVGRSVHAPREVRDVEWRIIETRSEKLWSGCTFSMKDGVRSETHTERCDCRGRSYFVKPSGKFFDHVRYRT